MAIEITHINESEYNEILLQAVAVLDNARGTAAKSLSTISNMAYFGMGKLLNERKLEGKYGDGVVKRLSVDLKQRFPNMGVSPRQLWNMKRFYVRFSSADEKLLRTVAVLPWSHILICMSKDLDDTALYYYATEAITKGWNRDLLLNAIKMQMHLNHQPTTISNNFAIALPTAQAMYVNEVFRSRYSLGFLGVTEPIAELELEQRLVERVKLFLLELGKGFTFIGNQYAVEYMGKESRIDMLFYHRGLRCLVAFELKIGKFKPEYAGKMNYYLSVLDRTERQEGENPSIGIILCAEKDNVDVELALEGVKKPIGVADYQLILPKDDLVKIVQDEIDIYIKDTNKENNNA
ncbi:MAG: DUF1016 family protein [Bacteroidales bacterium]|nr:DUF1016 family protein [Bacteroidales bacterium]